MTDSFEPGSKELPKSSEIEEIEKSPSSDSIKVAASRSLFFYVDLATKFLHDQETVELSGLGNAINTVVTVAEILKKQGVAKIKNIQTSQVVPPERNVPTTPKPKISIYIQKSDKFATVFAEKQKLAAENKEINELLKQKQQVLQDRLKKEEQERENRKH